MVQGVGVREIWGCRVSGFRDLEDVGRFSQGVLPILMCFAGKDFPTHVRMHGESAGRSKYWTMGKHGQALNISGNDGKIKESREIPTNVLVLGVWAPQVSGFGVY